MTIDRFCVTMKQEGNQTGFNGMGVAYFAGEENTCTELRLVK